MNQVRIIGGEWKRRLISFETLDGLRPTPDRVRETLFNWLMWETTGKQVLDVCAGSGALGFEALSRGAAHCTFIEPHARQSIQLQHNLQKLQATNAQVIAKTAEAALPLLRQQFDLVFLDPPYSLDLWEALALLIQPHLVANAKIYVEADRPLAQLTLPANWQLLKQTRAGKVHGGLYQHTPL